MPETVTATPDFAATYPDVAAELGGLPPHIVEDLGKRAIRLSHIDNHPVKLQEDGYAASTLRRDMEHRLTDPELDISMFDQQTIEAARAGQQRVAETLHGAAILLRSGHELIESTLDPDSHAYDTEDAIYDAAFKYASEQILATQDPAERAQLLESIILLEHVGRGKEAFSKVLRDLVHAGLAQEVVQAIKNDGQILEGSENSAVGKHLIDGGSTSKRLLLELGLGHKLSDGENVHGERDLSFTGSVTSLQEALDLIAVATSANSPFSNEQLRELLKLQFFADGFMAHMEMSTDQADRDRLFQAIQMSRGELRYLMEFADPAEAAAIANELELEPWQLGDLMGLQHSQGEMIEINDTEAAACIDFKKSQPELFAKFVSFAITRHDGQPMRGVAEMAHSMERIQASGVPAEMIVKQLYGSENRGEYTDTLLMAAHRLNKEGLHAAELAFFAELANTTIDKLVEDIQERGEAAIDDLLYKSQITQAYLKHYEADINFPLSPGEAVRAPKPTLEDLPFLSEKLAKLGISPELAAAMFESWDTYSALAKKIFNNEDFGQEQPSIAQLEEIAHDQAEGYAQHVAILEQYITEYGHESLGEVISTFGIYNFGRHTPEALHDQLGRWKAGEVVQTVVVDARSDWNSFSGSKPVFEPEVGKGVFYFEAASGHETGQVAVKIGKYERAAGREPEVSRFIVHGHGTEELMVMGPNRETGLIDIAQYRQAALKREKMKYRANDFRRHLGPKFEIVLQGCSVGGERVGGNLAGAVHDTHDAKVSAYHKTIYGVRIKADGSVSFKSDEGDGAPTVYA